MIDYKKDIIKIFNDKTRNKKFYANIVSVSNSGMSRKIKYYIIKNNQLIDITSYICETVGYKEDSKTWALKVGGCGMDMVWDVLYNLQRTLQPKTKYQTKNISYNLV